MNKHSVDAIPQETRNRHAVIHGFDMSWESGHQPLAGSIAMPCAATLVRPLDVIDPIPVEQIKSALERILVSGIFAKAQRMRHLLSFLVEKAIAGTIRDTNEYAIGIEVFGRDPASYNTCDDPIVRVQVGRLREKLKIYYAIAGRHDDLKLIIPVGSYMPTILRSRDLEGGLKPSHMLALLPLKSIQAQEQSTAFTQGLSEELAYQLFKEFGNNVLSHTIATMSDAGATKETSLNNVRHLFEGSVRIDGERVRVSVRLLDTVAGSIVWSEQFDRHASLDIPLQEELSLSIRTALTGYFCRN